VVIIEAEPRHLTFTRIYCIITLGTAGALCQKVGRRARSRRRGGRLIRGRSLIIPQLLELIKLVSGRQKFLMRPDSSPKRRRF
jgi:hypothetical protein